MRNKEGGGSLGVRATAVYRSSHPYCYGSVSDEGSDKNARNSEM